MPNQSTPAMIWEIAKKILPYLIPTLGLKLIVWFCERETWWPNIENPGIIIGVIGFGIAILLGAKLSVVNGRLYAIEDAVCRIVGSLRVLHLKSKLGKSSIEWAQMFEKTLGEPSEENINSMRKKTNLLIKTILDNGHDGGHLSNFSRDLSYVLHRATAEIPVAYELFLAMIIFLYTIVVAVIVPGMGGFVGIFILVVVLFGASVLIEDMDHPLDTQSLIVVNLEPLKSFIKQNEV